MEKKIETLEAVLVRNPRNFEIRHEIQQLKEAMEYLIARKPSLDGPSGMCASSRVISHVCVAMHSISLFIVIFFVCYLCAQMVKMMTVSR